MKSMLCVMTVFLFSVALVAQDHSQATNSLFDVSEAKVFNPGKILVQGEVQEPGMVDLSQLPLHNAPVKELALENGKQTFKGAYFISGYALCDILNKKQAKKSPENTFKPLVDMYVIVENSKGEKAVFSWGEIFHRDSYHILIAKTIQPVNPARLKTSWPLPAESRLISADDLLNVRFISNPAKITVKSYHGNAAPETVKDIYSPEIRITTLTGSAVIRDIGSAIEKRHYDSVLYGHGMGFKEVLSFSGYLFKDVIAAHVKITADNLKSAIFVISAKDGYRSVFSISEIMNRNDNQDILLRDVKDSPSEGRYTLVITDFFADRDVRVIDKIEMLTAD